MAYTGKNLVRRMEWQLDLALREQQEPGGSLRKETEVQCGIVRLLYEDGSLSEKEYEDIVELLYAKEKGGKQK